MSPPLALWIKSCLDSMEGADGVESGDTGRLSFPPRKTRPHPWHRGTVILIQVPDYKMAQRPRAPPSPRTVPRPLLQKITIYSSSSLVLCNRPTPLIPSPELMVTGDPSSAEDLTTGGERKPKEGQEPENSEGPLERPRRGSFDGGGYEYERGGYPGRRGRGINGYGRGYVRNCSRGGYSQYQRGIIAVTIIF